MNSLDELVFGLGSGLAEPAVGLGERDRGWGLLVPSQMFFHLKPRAMVGLLGANNTGALPRAQLDRSGLYAHGTGTVSLWWQERVLGWTVCRSYGRGSPFLYADWCRSPLEGNHTQVGH